MYPQISVASIYEKNVCQVLKAFALPPYEDEYWSGYVTYGHYVLITNAYIRCLIISERCRYNIGSTFAIALICKLVSRPRATQFISPFNPDFLLFSI